MIELKRTDNANVFFKNLISRLDKELAERNGEIQRLYNPHNILESLDTVIITMDNNIPVACGCFKQYDNTTVEIKRMYVETDHRGKGISKMILGALENWAKELGYKQSILETGIHQTEAIGLYEKSGYKRINNYGQYAGLENSICMMKELVY